MAGDCKDNKHDWWCVPGERLKSNPEQIIITCLHCNARIQAKVADHWTELEKLHQERQERQEENR